MRLLLRGAGLLALCGVAGVAQQQSVQQEEPIHTLHVYADLVQVPTLVLWENQQPLSKPIEERRFSISIDGGPWFRVTHARLEGKDPISLSILLDTNARDMMAGIGDAVASLGPQLTSKDHISIYAMDCGLLRSLNDEPVDSGRLKPGVDAALLSWTMRGRKRAHGCVRNTANLWDSLGYVAGQEADLPGRRVVLAVTDGEDRGSKRSWNDVRILTQAAGVTVFAVTNVTAAASTGERNWMMQRSKSGSPLQAICQLSGGIVTATYPALMEKTLKQVVTMLRQRYIVEFPRPANSTSGQHDMRVRVAKGEDFFIRPSEISIPLPDPALLKDPTTVPSDPTLTPEQGNRRVSNPK